MITSLAHRASRLAHLAAKLQSRSLSTRKWAAERPAEGKRVEKGVMKNFKKPPSLKSTMLELQLPQYLLLRHFSVLTHQCPSRVPDSRVSWLRKKIFKKLVERVFSWSSTTFWAIKMVYLVGRRELCRKVSLSNSVCWKVMAGICFLFDKQWGKRTKKLCRRDA